MVTTRFLVPTIVLVAVLASHVFAVDVLAVDVLTVDGHAVDGHAVDGADKVPAGISDFITSHCADCHSGDDSDAGLDLGLLTFDLDDEATFAKWERIHDRVASGEMPPPDYESLERSVREPFTNPLGESLTVSHAANKGTVLRRLNRSEYENTLNDLFGTHLSLVEMLPEDGRSHEFDNVGESLSVSTVQLQSYLNAADMVLDAAIAKELDKPEAVVVRASYADTRDAAKFLGKQWLLLNDSAVVFFHPFSYPTGMLREAITQEAGFYKIRVHGYAYQSDDPVTFSLGSSSFARGSAKPIYGFYEMKARTESGSSTTVETTVWMEPRFMVTVEPKGIGYPPNRQKTARIENYTGPGLAIEWIEIEGPIVSEFPSKGHELIYSGLDRQEVPPRNQRERQKSWYQPKFEIPEDNIDQRITESLQRIASRAFRRPVNATDIQPFVDLFDSQRQAGETIEQALRTAVSAILCSTDFLFFRESAGWLDDHAIATRLSYFLHRSSPDDELLKLASAGKLASNPDVLRQQVRRLLNAPKSERFVHDFADAWLDLRDIDFTAPDQLLFPEFDVYLRHSMVDETRAFIRKLIDDDLPAVNIVKSDFAMLNERLAEHYRIDGVEGPQIRPVELSPESLRGGLMSQASILKVSANGTNTSPVVRGVWVNERILGHSPPPPPPGIAGVEPDIRGATTLRELLDRHRDSDTCRSCHQLIDPPGFALESFNPIGGYRERFRTIGDTKRASRMVGGRRVRYSIGPDVDPSGTTADGTAFSGFAQYRDHLARDVDRIAKTLTKKLLVFSTGREMGFSDRKEIMRIVQSSAKNRHGVRSLIEEVVLSEIFRRK